MSKITPFLWFDSQAEEAALFYTSIFKNSKITNVSRGGPDGPVMIVNFELDGQAVIALNGGPMFPFSEAFSFSVDCVDQAEVDYFWEHLLAGGGQESQCGWLKDKFGLSWQIVPRALGELMGDPDPVKSQRVMQAMLKMVKLDVPTLQRAYAGE
jgi:predicted 3-demethylubiquinone-9 3-methyltransferase (glyoxalase superfamily)